MNKYEAEVARIGGDKLMSAAREEFIKEFFIVARTDKIIVLGDETKNVSFSRKNSRVIERNVFERNVFDGARGIQRKK